MIPILYAKNASDFSNNGMGLLRDAISCEVTEERNGAYTVTLKYPIVGNWFSSISEGSIIKAKPNEFSDPQLFRIYKSSKPINGVVTFYGNHISYDLSGIPVMSLVMEHTMPADAITEALEEAPIASGFTVWSDIESYHSINIKEPRSARAVIGGQAGSVIDVWGGAELEFDNFLIKLHRARGLNNGVVLRYGKNITDAKQERNIDACYTHLCPYAVKTVDITDESGEIVDQQKITVKLTENVIQLIDPHDIGHSRAMILDMTEKFGEGEEITEQALRTKAEAYIDSHDMGTPRVSITVKFLQVWDTPDYEDFAALERVKLCDSVTVRFEELGIESTAKVVKTVYDTLSERYSSIEVGSIKKTLADSFENVEEKIKETAAAVSAEKNSQRAGLNNAIVEATNRITGNAGGYVVLHPANYPSEILVMNSNNIQTATKVWRWNSSGLGYSENGYNGPYGLAMTMDGSIVADYIKTGTLTALNISGCTISGGTLNIGSGKFQVDSSGNAHTEGYVKATSGEIGDCSIVEGLLQVPAAQITGTLSASQIDATNLHVAAANVTGKLSANQINGKYLEIEDADVSGTIKAYSLNSPFSVADGTVKLTISSGNISITRVGYGTSTSEYSIVINVSISEITSHPFTCYAFANIKARLVTSYKEYTWLVPIEINLPPNSSATTKTYGKSITVEKPEAVIPEIINYELSFLGSEIGHESEITVDFYGRRYADLSPVIVNGSVIPTFNALGDGSGGFDLGSTDKKWDEVYCVNIQPISARMYKKDIADLSDKHEVLFDHLRPRRFKFINGESGREHYGLILDELRDAIDQADLSTDECAAYCLADKEKPDDDGGIRYMELIALCVNEIQKLKARVAHLEELLTTQGVQI